MRSGMGSCGRAALLAATFLVISAGAAPAVPVCGGDCDLNGEVLVNELLVGVNIALGNAPAATCAAMDVDGGREVTVSDLVSAVNTALEGCPAITCDPPAGGRCVEITPGPEAQDAILTALLEAQPHDVIFLRAGRYDLDEQLSLDVDDVTIRGEGTQRTILSFRNQRSGAEGLLVQANRFTLEHLALEDGPGDLFKALGGDGITVRGVRAEWTNGPDTSNGAYAIYPVQCRDVLIEDCVVRGASDAGLYVGQSRNIVVRRNRVSENVAGIEIENSTDADVYLNLATANTGGILVFNLPGPQVQDGRRTRLSDNAVIANNTPNFAPAGNIVSTVPTGTGVMILANDQVEIANNELRDNDTSHIVLISYNTAQLFGASPPNNPDFDPFSETIFIYGNTFVGGGTNPPDDLDPVVALNGGLPLPNILFDGDANPARLVEETIPDPLRTCVDQPGATVLNLDVLHNFAGLNKDLSQLACTHPLLSAVTIGAGRVVEITPGPGAQEALLSALLEAQPGDDIFIRAGTYELDTPLSLTVDHVTVRGEGMDQTILRFPGLAAGAQGLLVQNVSDFTLRDLAIEDSPGDQFKAVGVDGLRVQRVRTEWTAGPQPTNGSYGIYPVQCKDVLIEDSVARGASDTGFYVGQSRNIIVRNNLAELNVAGIEIENSTGADVHGNTTRDNAAGVLVFNLPQLPVFGERTRVFDNDILQNNTTNFAPEGNLVSLAPTGTGLLVLSNDKVEAFGNRFEDNNTVHVIVLSHNSLEVLAGPQPDDPAFDPYPESIYVHDNSYTGGGTMPPASLDFLVTLLGGLPVPQILYDGDVDPAKLEDGMLPAALRTCIQETGVTFANLNVPTFQTVPMIERDLAPFDCTLGRLTPIAIAGVQ